MCDIPLLNPQRLSLAGEDSERAVRNCGRHHPDGGRLCRRGRGEHPSAIDTDGTLHCNGTGTVTATATWASENITATKQITIATPENNTLEINADDTYTTADTPTITAVAKKNGTADSTATITWTSPDNTSKSISRLAVTPAKALVIPCISTSGGTAFSLFIAPFPFFQKKEGATKAPSLIFEVFI